MRILFLTHYFHPEVNAPAVRTLAHCREWAAAGHEVHVLTCFPSHPAGRIYDGYRMRWYRHELVDGIHVHRVPTYLAANKGRRRRSLNYLSYVPSALWRAARLPRPDVVIATSPQFFVAVAGRLAALLRRRPWIFEVRDLWPASLEAVGVLDRDSRLLRAMEWLELRLYRSALAVVVVSRSFADDLAGRGVAGARIAYVPNGVDLEELAAAADAGNAEKRALAATSGDVVISYIGTLGMSHGVDTLLRAAADLSVKGARAHVVIVGDGAQRESLEAWVARRELRNVTFLGQVPRERALALLQATDIVVVLLRALPLFEMVIPSKMLEAMGVGRPVVLGVRGEARRILVDEAGAGVGVPPEDPGAMSEALAQLSGDPEHRAELGRRGARYAAAHFSRSAWAAEYLREIERRLDEVR